jgi:hypothetical protein
MGVFEDADVLTPEQRRREVAKILAAAVLRLRSRAALVPAIGELPPPRIMPKTTANPLDVSAETRLSVHPG